MDVWFYAKHMKSLLEKKKHAFQSSEDGGVVLYFIALETTPILSAGTVSYTHNAKDSKGN